RVSSAFAPPRSLESAAAFCIGVPFSEICSSPARSELLKATTTRSSSDSRRKTYELSSEARCQSWPPRSATCSRRIRSNSRTYEKTSCCSPVLPACVKPLFVSSGHPPVKIPPVVRVAASRHSNLIAVIDLRNAAQSQRQPERQLQFRRGTPFGTRKAWHVVICK